MKTDAMTLKNGITVNYVGNSDLLEEKHAKHRFAFAGARKGVTKASRDWINEMVAILDSNRDILVSGLAIGSDTYAHAAALENNVPQVAVLPSGVNNVYPRQNKELAASIVENGGVLISILPNKASPSRNSFLERNKLIIDLSYLLVVNQFNWPSGTLNTVNNAKKQGKMIIIQKADFTGNKRIIEDGAYRTIIK